MSIAKECLIHTHTEEQRALLINNSNMIRSLPWAKPRRFPIFLLNHSDILLLIISFVVLQSASIFVLMKIIFHLAAFICVCSHQSQSHRNQNKLHVDSLTQVGSSQQNNWCAKKIIFIIINVASKRELCPYRRVAVTRFKTCGGDSQKISNLPPWARRHTVYVSLMCASMFVLIKNLLSCCLWYIVMSGPAPISIGMRLNHGSRIEAEQNTQNRAYYFDLWRSPYFPALPQNLTLCKLFHSNHNTLNALSAPSAVFHDIFNICYLIWGLAFVGQLTYWFGLINHCSSAVEYLGRTIV